MADETEVVDSTEEGAADTVPTSEPAAQQPQAQTGERTYTETELDARIKARVDKQRGKFEQQISEKDAAIAELTAERDALRAEAEVNAARNAAAAETGVPVSLLTGTTVDEINAQAAAIAAYAATQPKHTPYADDGAPKQPQRMTRSDIAQIKDAKERKQAYFDNLDSLT